MRTVGGPKSRKLGTVLGAATLTVGLLTGIAQGQGADPPAATITGDPVVGETLTASPGTNFKWQRCLPALGACGPERHDLGWVDITVEGTDPTYVVSLNDVDHLIRVLAKDTSLGTQYAPSPPVGPVPRPPAPPPPPPAIVEGDTGPVFDQTGDLTPTQGIVEVQLPNGQVRQIQEVTEIPVGSIVDVSNGHAILTTQRTPGGPLQSTEEWGAAFKFDQRAENAITKLTLAHSVGGPADRAVAERRGHRRGLWGRGHCRCRTSGQNSSGTARGTFYLVKETSEGTVTRVKRGKVLVKNFNNGKKVLLTKGESYLAEKKNR